MICFSGYRGSKSRLEKFVVQIFRSDESDSKVPPPISFYKMKRNLAFKIALLAFLMVNFGVFAQAPAETVTSWKGLIK